MKKKLLGLILCFGFVCLFGVSNKNYEISNIIYTEDNSNLIGKEVSVRGIDDTKFNIIGIDGKKVRLLSNEMTSGRYNYNSSSDGDIPVAFENSQAYQALMDNYGKFKDEIAAAGGDTSIFELDIPTVEEFCDLGYLEKGFYIISVAGGTKVEDKDGNYRYYTNENTPRWLFETSFDTGSWFTRSISKDGKSLYSFIRAFYSYNNSYDNYVSLRSPYYIETHLYGSSIRPVLETSAVNLISSDSDIMSYVNSFAASNSNENKNDNSNNDKAQMVKVPSTGANAPLIFTVVGIAVIVIAGIVIWVLVKNNKGKK